ncbi:MAG TPA: hypothetical protein VFR88_06380 [Microlunatus sp.]|nr:hypothetical protein [Microlunatus sp.]
MTASGHDAGEASTATGIERVAPARRAAGIYGLIVTASVLATGGTSLPVLPLAVAVFVTLLVYWLAEEYAELLEHAHSGRLPTWTRTKSLLVSKWPMVSASYIPLIILVVARVLGATTSNAALFALIGTVVLLMASAWRAGRSATLTGVALVGMTVLAGLLGLGMIALKVGLTHLH